MGPDTAPRLCSAYRNCTRSAHASTSAANAVATAALETAVAYAEEVQQVRDSIPGLVEEAFEEGEEYAREWIMENKANRPVFNALTQRDAEHPIEVVGARLRQMMSWLRKEGI